MYDVGEVDDEQLMSHSRALDRASDLEFLGAIDPNPAARRMFSETYAQPVFASVKEAAATVSPDIVVIASGTESHLEVVEQVCGVIQPRIILCEKPLAFQLPDAELVVDICSRAGVRLFVNYMRRVDPASKAIGKRLETGTLGPFTAGSCYYSRGLLNNASHIVNILESWFGKPKVSAATLDAESARVASDPDIHFTLVFDRLQVDFRALPETSSSQASLLLWGPSSRLDYDWGGWHIRVFNLLDAVRDFEGVVIPSALSRIQGEVASALVRALKGESTNLCSGREALETLRICHEVIDQARGRHA